ncbi:hypothetical protein ACFS7Z_19085 [Pontibacter toksunensis]|uniref:Uncharacterized protein n=1 Tax=Pontibacter toksunensis TaxID=1332631 RepID=A0ABW6BYM2_9BACT
MSALALTLTVGCNNQPAEEVEKETVVVEKETVKVVEAPVAKVVLEEQKVKSVKIGPDGSSVKTKSVDVEIKHYNILVQNKKSRSVRLAFLVL